MAERRFALGCFNNSARLLHQQAAGVCQNFCVRPVIRHEFTKRSLNMTANCVLASAHSRGGRFHSAAAWFKTKYSSFVAASSEKMSSGSDGKMSSGSDARRSSRVQRLDGIRGVDDPSHAFGESEERNYELPVAAPALRDCRIFYAPGTLRKGVEGDLTGCGSIGRAIDRTQRLRQALADPSTRQNPWNGGSGGRCRFERLSVGKQHLWPRESPSGHRPRR